MSPPTPNDLFLSLCQEGVVFLTLNAHHQDYLNLKHFFFEEKDDELAFQCQEQGCLWELCLPNEEKGRQAATLSALFEGAPQSTATYDFLTTWGLLCSFVFKEDETNAEEFDTKTSLECHIVPQHEFYNPQTHEVISEDCQDCGLSASVARTLPYVAMMHIYHNPNSFSSIMCTSPQQMVEKILTVGWDRKKLPPNICKSLPADWQLVVFNQLGGHNWDDHYGPFEEYKKSWHDAFSDFINQQLPTEDKRKPHLKKSM